jgi:hypothetical protein
MAINHLLKRMSDFYPPLQSGDLLLSAKYLFVAAMVASVGRKIATRGTLSVTNVTISFYFRLASFGQRPAFLDRVICALG